MALHCKTIETKLVAQRKNQEKRRFPCLVRTLHVAGTEMEIDDDNLTAEFGCDPALATWI